MKDFYNVPFKLVIMCDKAISCCITFLIDFTYNCLIILFDNETKELMCFDFLEIYSCPTFFYLTLTTKTELRRQQLCWYLMQLIVLRIQVEIICRAYVELYNNALEFGIGSKVSVLLDMRCLRWGTRPKGALASFSICYIDSHSGDFTLYNDIYTHVEFIPNVVRMSL